MNEELDSAAAAVLDDVRCVLNEPESGSAELRKAKTLSRVVGEFFSKTTKGSFPEFASVLEDRRGYVREVVAVKKAMAVLRRDCAAISRARNNGSADDRLRISLASVLQQMKKVVEVCEKVVTDYCEGDNQKRANVIVRDIGDELNIYDVDYAEPVEVAPAEPGGGTGSVALGAFFTMRAKAERRIAHWLRVGVIGLLGMIAGLAAWILFRSPLDSDTLVRELARLSTTVPLAVLAGYLSRESSRHRNIADRSVELGAHLNHLDDYVVELSEEERRRYRYELGQSAYVADKPGVGDTNSPGLAAEEVARIVEAIKGLASRA